MTDFIQRNDATATDKRSVDILVPVGVFEHGETECECSSCRTSRLAEALRRAVINSARSASKPLRSRSCLPV